MRATDILSQEHQVILRVLDCLDRLLTEGAELGQVHGDHARQALEFFATFADGCHHGKEEEHLFPKLVAGGLPRHSGPIAVMLREHDIGREAMQGMRATLDAAAAGEKIGLDTFIQWGRTYVTLLREHIIKEDNILFPMATNYLTDDAHQAVLEGFAKAESSHDPGTHFKMLSLANNLCDAFGVPKLEVDPYAPATHGGCMHPEHGA